MPRTWQTHWPIPAGGTESDRERIIHTLGNLTLVTRSLNSKISNGPWGGESGKRAALKEHNVLLLNHDLDRQADDQWTNDAVRARTQRLAQVVSQIWATPQGHRVRHGPKPHKVFRVELTDLIANGALQPGISLIPRRKQYRDRIATLLPDGRVEIDGLAFSNPTDAASKIVGKRMGGWWFFFVDPTSRRSLRDVRNDYVRTMALDAEDDEADEEGEEDED
jgi:hypothetical protein